jgi:hypothetical protein
VSRPPPQPPPQAEAEWEQFLQDNPDAEVVWGTRFGRPSLLYGFEPIDAAHDYVGAVRAFMAGLPAMFGLSDANLPGVTLTALTDPHLVYHCDRSRMTPLPGLIEKQMIEPRCPEVSILSLGQMINGLPFLSGGLGAVFDKQGRLTKLLGEYIGGVPAPAPPEISKTDAVAAALAALDLTEADVAILSADVGYKFYDQELLAVWVIRLVTLDDRRDLSFLVDAEDGQVLAVTDNVDYYIDDTNDEVDFGWTLDNQSAIECNEPANRWRWIDTTYAAGAARGAFNPDAHVYDMEREDDCTVGLLRSNRYFGTYKFFDYRLDHQHGSTWHNAGNQTIQTYDISTWTAFNHVLANYNYFRNVLGFSDDYIVIGGVATRNRYDLGHNLTVIVNKNPYDSTFCGEGHSGCFKDWGFPSAEGDCGTGNPGYKAFWPYYEVDQNPTHEEVGAHAPTIVLGRSSTVFAGDYFPNTAYVGLTNPTMIYHEFTHYVEKAYAGPEYWEPDGGTVFNEVETPTLKEGFAMYFGASREDIGPGNFDLSNIGFYSHQYNLDYQETFICCNSVYDRGRVLAQILWDLRNGFSGAGVNENALGREYTDKLAFQAILQAALGEYDTLTTLYALMRSISTDELSDECPTGDYLDCRDMIHDVFERHGVCTGSPCQYPAHSCGGGDYCDDAICGNVDRCQGANLVSPDPETEFACCTSTNGTHHRACYGSSVVLCGLYSSLDDCATDCRYYLWSYDFRECLAHLGYPNCKCCETLCDNDHVRLCFGYNSVEQCVALCTGTGYWTLERTKCALNDMRYPEACDVCD